MAAPVLETSRLVLRAHKMEDLADCVAMWLDPVITRFTIGEASTEQRTWLRVLGYRGHWEMMGYGYWAVEEKQSGRYIGEMGYADFKRGIELTRGIPELGWALVSSVHGKGYPPKHSRRSLSGEIRTWASPGRSVSSNLKIMFPFVWRGNLGSTNLRKR